MPTSPNVNNYHIGKGIVSFKEAGASVFADLGNAPKFIYTPTITKKNISARERASKLRTSRQSPRSARPSKLRSTKSPATISVSLRLPSRASTPTATSP